MKAIEALERVLTSGLDNTCCGTIKIDSSASESCEVQFGSFRAIIAPKPFTTYLYEWRHAEWPNEIGEPDALLIQPSNDGTMLVYLYELDEN